VNILQRATLVSRKIKRTLELLIYFPFDSIPSITRQTKKIKNNRIAIIHAKLLGDYIIWLPFGQAIVNYYKKENDIVLIVNSQLEQIAKINFPDCKIVGINLNSFLRNPRYRLSTLYTIRDLAPLKTLHDSAPRDALIGDALVRALGCPAIGFDALFSDRTWIDRVLHAQYYSQLLPAIEKAHQVARHTSFALACGVPLTSITFPQLDGCVGHNPLNQPYFVISPGASQTYRRWQTDSFITLAKQIHCLHPDWKVAIIGTAGEFSIAQKITSTLSDYSINLAGKTTILEMINYIAHAKILLGNDSAAPHIAAALGTTSIAIVGGGHFGRCLPYPSANTFIRSHPIVITKPMDCFGCDWLCRYQSHLGSPMPCINEINADYVWNMIEKTIKSI
jgi:ADP-heptose:LPS heptosyltransferase